MLLPARLSELAQVAAPPQKSGRYSGTNHLVFADLCYPVRDYERGTGHYGLPDLGRT